MDPGWRFCFRKAAPACNGVGYSLPAGPTCRLVEAEEVVVDAPVDDVAAPLVEVNAGGERGADTDEAADDETGAVDIVAGLCRCSQRLDLCPEDVAGVENYSRLTHMDTETWDLSKRSDRCELKREKQLTMGY